MRLMRLVLSGALTAAATVALAQGPLPRVELKTTQGTIVVELDAEKAPNTVKNFVRYVNEGHYDGTIFHRVINGFMVQGGGYGQDLKERPTHEPIAIESKNGLSNRIGTIAMARTADPNSATAQFFINVSDNTNLDYPGRDGYGYTVFGRVVEGMDAVTKIKGLPTQPQGIHQNVPVTPVVITKATVLKK